MKSLRARAHAAGAGGVGLAGTLLLHALAATLMFLAARRPDPRPSLPAYRVELVAAPRPPAVSPEATAPTEAPPAREATPAVTRPTPTPPTRTPPSPTPARTPTPTRAPTASAALPPRDSARAPAEPAVTQPGPTGTGGVGADPATIRTEGVEFPFPGYLRNLVSQVYRRWRPPGGNSNLEAEIFFFVQRDGTISGLQFIRRSGSFGFDLEAQGAVEAAARAAAFGALPQGFGPDMLPVSFFFSPRAVR